MFATGLTGRSHKNKEREPFLIFGHKCEVRVDLVATLAANLLQLLDTPVRFGMMPFGCLQFFCNCKRFALPASAQPSLREGSGTPKSSVGKVRILRLGPGQGGLGWALLGRVAGWAGLKPVLGGLGCGLLARVAGWAGPEAVSRQVRQAGLAWLGWATG